MTNLAAWNFKIFFRPRQSARTTGYWGWGIISLYKHWEIIPAGDWRRREYTGIRRVTHVQAQRRRNAKQMDSPVEITFFTF
jgi:hypothetical protein